MERPFAEHCGSIKIDFNVGPVHLHTAESQLLNPGRPPGGFHFARLPNRRSGTVAKFGTGISPTKAGVGQQGNDRGGNYDAQTPPTVFKVGTSNHVCHENLHLTQR
jgi:hypothetical protein